MPRFTYATKIRKRSCQILVPPRLHLTCSLKFKLPLYKFHIPAPTFPHSRTYLLTFPCPLTPFPVPTTHLPMLFTSYIPIDTYQPSCGYLPHFPLSHVHLLPFLFPLTKFHAPTHPPGYSFFSWHPKHKSKSSQLLQ